MPTPNGGHWPMVAFTFGNYLSLPLKASRRKQSGEMEMEMEGGLGRRRAMKPPY